MKRLVLLSLVALLSACGSEPKLAPVDPAWSHVHRPALHTDHASFFEGPFEDGPAVTRACLECHDDEAHAFMQTAHWRWEGAPVEVPGHEGTHRIGKKNLINNFCIGVQSNWAACTTCHAGYGWKDADFDFEDASHVDCLVCHDQTGTYAKKGFSAGAVAPGVDLLAVARSVGRPTRSNCGTCHFNGGGGNGVKHGDLDMTLAFPSARVDVHMGRHKLTCVDCHQTKDHRIPGRSMSVSVDHADAVACTDCHAAKPHQDARLDAHTARLACQTCHIPRMARQEPTKMTWDWSKAGQDRPEDHYAYLKIKGAFHWAREVMPEYAWWDGTTDRYLVGDRIDPSKVTRIAGPRGSKDEVGAKIWPFKVHRGKQIYDTENLTFMVPNLAGPEGFWTKFDWERALENGSKVTGQPYSGHYDFAPTEMFWPLSHMVAPKDEALTCRDCHGEGGRMDWKALGYDHDPLGRDALEHERLTLLDAEGEPAAESGKAPSTTQTCGQCHELTDESFQAAHAYHRRLDPAALPEARRALLVEGPRLPADSGEEMNCLLCHAEQADLEGRAAALSAGAADWSVAATRPGLVRRDESGYALDPAALDADGTVDLGLARVPASACGACHGAVAEGPAPVTVTYGTNAGATRMTELTGEVFSSQRVRLSGMNLADKDAKGRPFDVHAQRLVSCRDCHYAQARPDRLAGEIAKADAPKPGELRRCESCHATEGTHPWLPQAERHLAAVACEACHVSEGVLPAREQVDRTLVDLEGRPVLHYRGGDPREGPGALLKSWAPVLLPADVAPGETKLAPFNLVSEWTWIDAAGRTVTDAQVRTACLEGGRWRPALLAALDGDGDGRLSEVELRLDTPEKAAVVADALTHLGVKGPRIVGRVQAVALHHGVTPGGAAVRDCATCHQVGEGAPAPFDLAAYLPGEVRPVPVGPAQSTLGDWQTRAGTLRYAPAARPVAGNPLASEATR